MTDISKIKGLLDWKLLNGSHDWPGPDGGTCINEAAIVVAGFDYTPVAGAEDFPPCFSKELGMLLLTLNDDVSDERRQQLMRFVPRLPGSRDNARMERARCRHMREAATRLLAQAGLDCDALPRRIRSRQDRFWFVEQLGATLCWAFERSPLAAQTREDLYGQALDIVEQAFAIGRQADPLDAALVEARLAQAHDAWTHAAA